MASFSVISRSLGRFCVALPVVITRRRWIGGFRHAHRRFQTGLTLGLPRIMGQKFSGDWVSEHRADADPVLLDKARTRPREMTDEEWRQVLTPKQFDVARGHGTEPAFTGYYADNKDPGEIRVAWRDSMLKIHEKGCFLSCYNSSPGRP